MVAQKSQKNVTVASITELPAQPISLTAESQDLAALRMQAKAIAEQIKAAKANQPKRSRLEAVIHAQTVQHDSSVDRKIANRVRARVNAGQSRAEAMNAVFEFYRNLADERLDKDEMPEDDRTEEEQEVK